MRGPINWSTLPDDLVPLADVARRLKVPIGKLVKASREGKFPPIFCPAGRIYLVSQAELDVIARERWTDMLEAAARVKARWIRARMAEGEAETLQRAAPET